MDQVIWITGAGSGMGRACAVDQATSGRRLALSGRRPDALQETAELVRRAGGEALVVPVDVRQDDAALAAQHILNTWGRLNALVLAAGTNATQRSWADHDLADFDAIITTNLTGVARVITAALPGLRAAKGVVVAISSYAGWTHSPSAGVAYGASKTALGVLTRTLNTQEAHHGVRACHLCPGDTDTELLDRRPVVPSDEARARMLTPQDVAAAVRFVVDAPAHVRIDELVISPVSQV